MYSARDILWVKNVKRDGGDDIAYYAPNDEIEFHLNWSSRFIDEKEALKPEVGDIILLFQHINAFGQVQLTHLVTPIDSQVFRGDNPQYIWERKVKVIARAPNAYNPKPDTLNFLRPNQGGSYDIRLLNHEGPLDVTQNIVWNCFQDMFREGLDNIEDGILNQNLGSTDLSAPEGAEKRKLRWHLLRERNSKLVTEKKQQAIAANNLNCECCEFNFESNYGSVGAGFIECHHKIHVNQGERITKLGDLALVCSNCHRMLHRKDSDGEYPTVEQLETIFKERKN